MPDSLTSVHQVPDTTVADTLNTATQTPFAAPASLEPRTCHETDGPRILHLRNATLGRMAYAEGIAPRSRTILPGYDSGVMCLLIAVFIFTASSLRHYSTFLKTFTQDLFSVRQRANAFDQTDTMSETRVQFSLIILLCVCEGVLLYGYGLYRGHHLPPFTAVGLLAAVCGIYYLAQLAAYAFTGYLFAPTDTDTSLWIRGYNASQALLALLIAVPALLSLFNPSLMPLLLSIAIVLYCAARIIFISKGFRIFYKNFGSLVYFILYLCTLEIIPPIAMFSVVSMWM